MFFVQKILENGWSRNILLNFMYTDLYERQGKAISNFKMPLPPSQSDLAKEMAKDSYKFYSKDIVRRNYLILNNPLSES